MGPSSQAEEYEGEPLKRRSTPLSPQDNRWGSFSLMGQQRALSSSLTLIGDGDSVA